MALREEAQSYVDEHWDEILDDIQALVSIESVRDERTVGPGAPYGEGPAAALEAALKIAEGYGFDVHNCDGYIGYADLPGVSDTQIGIIGHVDVVPAGPDWDSDPYTLTRKDGYLLGRGVMDDKGPLLVALHALRFLKDRGIQLPYTVRVLVGACEETTMEDVDYYREHFNDPDFLFSPDGQYPVIYGEAGIAHGVLTSSPCTEGNIMSIEGGQATNAVPGEAHALVRGALVPGTYGPITVERADETGETVAPAKPGIYHVNAVGVSAHASLPHLGENAIGLLVDFLLEQKIPTPEETEFLELVQSVYHNPDGSTLGIDSNDEHFGDLTVTPTLLTKEEDVFVQWFDLRYPTVITGDQIEKSISSIAFAFGATFSLNHDAAPFVMDPNSSPVRALLDAYCQVTDGEALATTSKGGTYARKFSHGVCFGPEKRDEKNPDWVGGIHGANEGVSEDLLKEAFVVYALALSNLMKCEF